MTVATECVLAPLSHPQVHLLAWNNCCTHVVMYITSHFSELLLCLWYLYFLNFLPRHILNPAGHLLTSLSVYLPICTHGTRTAGQIFMKFGIWEFKKKTVKPFWLQFKLDMLKESFRWISTHFWSKTFIKKSDRGKISRNFTSSAFSL